MTIENPETNIGVTNNKQEEVYTGIFTNNLPYIALIGFAGISLVFAAIKRRHRYDD